MLDLDRYRQALALPPFRAFWVGFTLSSFGDGMTRLALTWWVWEGTHSARALGVLTLCYTGPVVLGGLAAGWLLDRFDRRRVLQLDSLVRGVVVAAVPLLHVAGRLELWHVYAVAAVYGSLFMISLAGGPTIVPSLVPARLLPTANALETLGFTLSGVVAPPVAGALAATIGAPGVLGFDAATYFFFAIALTRVRCEASSGAREGERGIGLADAVRFVARSPILRSTTLMYAVVNVGGGLLVVWLPILADRTLQGDARLYGLLLGAIGAGSVASSFLSGAITLPVTFGRAICLALVGGSLPVASILLAPRVAVTLPALFLYGALVGPLTVWAQTLRMRIIPAGLRGRVFALLRTAMQGATPAGGVLGGVLVPAFGLAPAVLATAVCLLLPGLVGLTVRQLQRDDDGADPSRPPPEDRPVPDPRTEQPA